MSHLQNGKINTWEHNYWSPCLCDIPRQKCCENFVLSILDHAGFLFLYYCTNPARFTLHSYHDRDSRCGAWRHEPPFGFDLSWVRVVFNWRIFSNWCPAIPFYAFLLFSCCNNSLNMLLCLWDNGFLLFILLQDWLLEACHAIECLLHIIICLVLCVRILHDSPKTLHYSFCSVSTF